jgi:hypothetical protein
LHATLLASLGGDPLPSAVRLELQYAGLPPEEGSAGPIAAAAASSSSSTKRNKTYAALPPEQEGSSSSASMLPPSESGEKKRTRRRTAKGTSGSVLASKATSIRERCDEALKLIDDSDGIHALIPLGQTLKLTQAELTTAGEVLESFKPNRPSEAAAGSSKLDLLKHALRHNVNELKRFATLAHDDAAGGEDLLAKVEKLHSTFKL